MSEGDVQEIMEDLEDGEIESDGEQVEEPTPEPAKEEVPAKEAVAPFIEKQEHTLPPQTNVIKTDVNSQSNKDKKSKKKSKEKVHHSRSERGEHKSHKDKSKKFLLPSPVVDDFAGNIEKAIRKAMKGAQDNSDIKNDIEIEDSGIDDADSKRKNKKRKKHSQPNKEGTKKRKKQKESEEEMDEDEMMCVRGASPVMRQAPPSPQYPDYPSEDDYDSDSSDGSRDRGRSGRGRPTDRGRRMDRNRGRGRRPENSSRQDNDGVCQFFMNGKCYKGDECTYSHDAHPPRKMELCKFYLMECCAKKDKCLYLHSDFPCKYYHTGLPCIYKDECKFAHGKPLSDTLKNVLLKHIELAPKEILGEFPRLSRDAATMMVAVTQNKLMQQFGMKPKDKDKTGIPSIFDLNVPKPPNFDENQFNTDSLNQTEKPRNQKVRQSRWGDGNSFNQTASDDILSIQNLNGVLTPNQIAQLIQLGIKNLNQLSQLTVIQLNQLGLTLAQINDIQLNTMSIQKLGLINTQSSTAPSLFGKINKDLDMRVSPILTDLSMVPKTDIVGKDVDMRFQTNTLQDKDSRHNVETKRDIDPRKQNQQPFDSEQYTRDTMKYATESPENGNAEESDQVVNKDVESTSNPKPIMDYDHRVLQYISDATVANVKLSKDDSEPETKNDNTIDDSKSVTIVMKHQQQFIAQKKDKQDARRMTTDDEDENNLQIDEKWYSSDEEKHEKTKSFEEKIKSPPQQEEQPKYTPIPPQTNEMEATTVITKLGDLSKIDISAEVTKLLSTIKNTTPAEEKETKKEDPRLRDPRNMVKKSPEHKSSSSNVSKKSLSGSSKPSVVSIYNCLEGDVEDTRKKSDVDLRLINDVDFRLSKFGDTDLRQAAGSADVDLRLGLPFKSLPNYTPASEIDGSINSHPPIPFKLVTVHVPRPDYTEIRNSTPKSQASQDPRLRKIFRLSLDENVLDSTDKKDRDSRPARIDPRKKLQDGKDDKKESPKPPSLDLQAVIQTSDWYKDLSSNQKILVNQQLACVMASLKKFHQDPTPGKVFDLNEIHSNIVLTKIFANLGIILNEQGELTQVTLPDAMPPMNFMQNEAFNNMNMGNMMDNGMMNMANMNPMGSFGFQGNGQPGLLGMAPNIPLNYDGGFGNGMQNYNNDNNFNSNFDNSNNMFNNGPGGGGNMNEYNDNYDDSKFYNNKNRSNQKNDFNKPYPRGGRGNDRWRGSRGRDRRGFTERGGNGSWKGDRRNN